MVKINCGLVFWLSRVCSSAMDLNTWFSLGDRLLLIKMSPELCHLWIHCIQWKLLLTSPSCHPETFEGNLIHLLSLPGTVGLTARFSHILEMSKSGKRNGMCSGISCRGRVHAGFWVQSDWYVLVIARSKVWGQVLDPLSAFLMPGGALLCAVLWLLMLQLWWDEITHSRWTKEDKFTLNYLWTNSVITRDNLHERNCPEEET